ncbi:hypothetical protein D3C76_1838180 [compost metagenome]
MATRIELEIPFLDSRQDRSIPRFALLKTIQHLVRLFGQRAKFVIATVLQANACRFRADR